MATKNQLRNKKQKPVTLRVVTPAVPVKRRPSPVSTPKKRRSLPEFDLNSMFSDITTSVTSSLRRPTVLLSLIVVAALVITHYETFQTGFIGKWANTNAANNSVAKWIKENESRTLGLLIFVPTLLDLPSKVQAVTSVAVLFWVFIVPESTVLQYVLQSFSLHTYFRVRQSSSRLFIIAMVAIAYYVGWLAITK